MACEGVPLLVAIVCSGISISTNIKHLFLGKFNALLFFRIESGRAIPKGLLTVKTVVRCAVFLKLIPLLAVKTVARHPASTRAAAVDELLSGEIVEL
ncbi:MAG: hypothetical protein GX087_02235 [Desulfobulbaceae bacterium]|nr:hypothetical protein [Desulfobulbaceae bacterium]